MNHLNLPTNYCWSSILTKSNDVALNSIQRNSLFIHYLNKIRNTGKYIHSKVTINKEKPTPMLLHELKSESLILYLMLFSLLLGKSEKQANLKSILFNLRLDFYNLRFNALSSPNS